MASETTAVALDQDGTNNATDKQSGTVHPDSLSKGVDDTFAMATDELTEDAVRNTQEKSKSVANVQGAPEDDEWSVAKQCLSVFVIEVYQCKLCASFNSTQRATITNHLKEKHPTEWLILKDADNTSSLPGGSKTNAISRGDLEEMVEKELTDGNQRRSDVPKQGAIINLQGSSTESSSNREKTQVNLPVPVGNIATMIPVVAVRVPVVRLPIVQIPVVRLAGLPGLPGLPPSVRLTNIRPKIVRLQQQNTPNMAGTNRSGEDENKKRQWSHPKFLCSTVKTGSISLGDPGVQGVRSQSLSPRKSGEVHPGPLRPVLRRNAKCTPREFKDFVVSHHWKRRSASNKHDEENDEENDEEEKEDDDDEDDDKDDDDDYVPEKAEEQRDKEVLQSEQVPKENSKMPSKQPQQVVVQKNRGSVQRKLQCPKCLSLFGTADALSRHGKMKRCIGIPITSKEFPCDRCDYKGSSVASLKIHCHIHMQRKEKKYGCASCKRGFTTLKSVRRHRKNRCPVLKTKKPKVPKTYSCEQCGKVCKAKKALNEHLATHSEIRCYKCDCCKKAFKTYGALRRHRKKHKDSFVYCDQCNFRTRWPSSLKTHFQAHHSEDTREYLQCPQCQYQSQNKYYLRRHIESHLDTRLFICEICGKDFKTQVILNVHLETHGDGEYRCSKCNYVGKTKMAIYSHRLVHLPRELMSYKCEQCDWVGKRKSELRMHYRKHSSLKLYQCSGCGKSYKHKHALTRHMSEKHIEKTVDISNLEVEEMPSGENAVLDTVQDMLDSAHIGLQVTQHAEPHNMNGIPTILHHGTQLKRGIDMQHYQMVPGSQVVEEVEVDQADTMVTHHHPHQVIHNPNVVMTSVPEAQFFEITTTDGAGDGNIPVHTAQ